MLAVTLGKMPSLFVNVASEKWTRTCSRFVRYMPRKETESERSTAAVAMNGLLLGGSALAPFSRLVKSGGGDGGGPGKTPDGPLLWPKQEIARVQAHVLNSRRPFSFREGCLNGLTL